MKLQSCTEQITTQPIFSALNEKELSELIKHSHQLFIPKGKTIFSMGEEAKDFYLLSEGQVKISRNSVKGVEKILEIIRPGSLFAEALMFIPAATYPANGITLKDSSVICFNNQAFLTLLHSNPGLSIKLLGRLSQRLHEFVNEIDRLALQNAYLRVVNYLDSQLPDADGQTNKIELDAPKHTIASFISVTPETFSRTLKQLEDENIVRIKRNTILITDIDKLKNRVQLCHN